MGRSLECDAGFDRQFRVNLIFVWFSCRGPAHEARALCSQRTFILHFRLHIPRMLLTCILRIFIPGEEWKWRLLIPLRGRIGFLKKKIKKIRATLHHNLLLFLEKWAFANISRAIRTPGSRLLECACRVGGRAGWQAGRRPPARKPHKDEIYSKLTIESSITLQTPSHCIPRKIY